MIEPIPSALSCTWRVTCAGCGAVMTGMYVGDVILGMDRHGWSEGRCRGCRRAS